MRLWKDHKGRWLMHAISFSSEMQSLLLRFSIMLATSLSTLSDALDPHFIDSQAGTSASSSSLTPAVISSKITNDVRVLFNQARQTSTNLTLALRSSTSGDDDAARTGEKDNVEEGVSPTANLDTASLDAAKAQLTQLMNDVLPKLVYLSRKASSEAIASRRVPLSASERAEADAVRKAVKARGGTVVFHSALAGDDGEQAYKKERVWGRGLGSVWSGNVKDIVVDLVEDLIALSEAFMAPKTLSAVQRAAEARWKRDGGEGNRGAQRPSVMARTPCKTQKEARATALVAIGKVFDLCDAVLKGNKQKRGLLLVENNREAVKVGWKDRVEMASDALQELQDAIDAEAGNVDLDEEGEEEEETLNEEEKAEANRYAELIKAGIELEKQVGRALFASNIAASGAETEEKLDEYDRLDEAARELEERTDNLVSTVLYGVEDKDEEGSDDESDEDEEEKKDEKGSGTEAEIREKALKQARGAFVETSIKLAQSVSSAEKNVEVQKRLDEVKKLAAASF